MFPEGYTCAVQSCDPDPCGEGETCLIQESFPPIVTCAPPGDGCNLTCQDFQVCRSLCVGTCVMRLCTSFGEKFLPGPTRN